MGNKINEQLWEKKCIIEDCENVALIYSSFCAIHKKLKEKRDPDRTQMGNKFTNSTELLKEIKKSPGHEVLVLDEREIREGAYCTQCGKYIPKGKHSSRDGIINRYFFHLIRIYKRKHYFCSEKCDKKFWTSQNRDKLNCKEEK